MEKKTNEPSLKKSLSPISVWALAFGCVIGWGAFINPGKKFLPNSGIAGTAIAMILGALVMIVIAYSYAYMVPKYPKAGGEFTFTKACFGRIPAYICGWFLVSAYLTNVPMNSTAIGLIVDGLDGSADILKCGFSYKVAGFEVWFGEILLATFILILFGILNILGVRKAGFVQVILVTMLVTCAITLSVSGIYFARANDVSIQLAWGFDKSAAIASSATMSDINIYAHSGRGGVLSAILATFAIAPWAYVGFDTIPQAAEEYRFSFKKVMRIMILAISFGAYVYISNNTVAALVLDNWPERVMAGEWVLLVAAEELLGSFGKILIGIGVSSAVLSGIMGFYLASSRLMYSMSRDGFLPKWFSKVDEKYGTPKNAMLFCIIISLCGPILGREALGWFVDMSAIGASIGYFFTCAATLRTIRRDGDGTKITKLMAKLGGCFSVMFLILQLVPIPGLAGVNFCRESYILLVFWVMIGTILYIVQKRCYIKM